MKKNIILILVFGMCFVLLSILVEINNPVVSIFDNFFRTILTSRNDVLTNFFSIITQLVDIKGAIIIILCLSLLSIYKKRKYDLYLILTSTGLGIFCSTAFKYLFNRTRPITDIISETTPSFPSNHSLISIILMMLIIFTITKYIENIKFQYVLKIFVIILFSFIPLTRIILGVHYATDVLGGILLGLTIYFLSGIIIFLTSARKSDCFVCLK